MKRRVVKWNFLYTLETRFNLWSHFPSSEKSVPSASLQRKDVWEKTAPILLSWGQWIADTGRSSSIPVTLHEFNSLGKFQCLILHIWCCESAKAETLRNEVTRLPGVKANSQHREWMINTICGAVLCSSWGFWCFPPFAATDLSQKQITFASEWSQNGGSGKEKQTFVFWLSLSTQAVLGTIPWQSLPRQKPSLWSFSLRTTPWMSWHFIKWAKDCFSSLTHQEQPASPPAELGTLLPLPCKETAGAFSGAWQPPSFHFVAPCLQKPACWLWW